MKRGPKPKLLIVEDEFLIADMLQGILEDLGCEIVASAGSVDEALKIIETCSLEAAFVDLMLKEERAKAVIAALAERKIPFGLATGVSDETLDVSFAGANRLLRKPYSPNEVADVFCHLLGSRTFD